MRERSETRLQLVLSCEHGGNRVPPRWRGLFHGAERLLGSHRGWDPGALWLARLLSRRLAAPLVATTVTRLLVETNRSLGHPRLFSEITRGLREEERARILESYWRPHRRRVHEVVEDRLRKGAVLHLGVHSFTPVLDGELRDVDVGVLYDPRRSRERAFCRAWIRELREALPELRVRANAPYRGASDGLTTHLRRQLGVRYLGVELEVGQGLLADRGSARTRVAEGVARTLERRLWSAGPAQRARAATAAGPSPTASAARKRTTPTRGW